MRLVKIKDLDTDSEFFDIFRELYPDFMNWLERKKEDPVYVSFGESGEVLEFMKLKYEESKDDWKDIDPGFSPGPRLKMSSYKSVGHFSDDVREIIWNKAKELGVDEIYLTVFLDSGSRVEMIKKFEALGFREYGWKGKEKVYVWKLR